MDKLIKEINEAVLRNTESKCHLDFTTILLPLVHDETRFIVKLLSRGNLDCTGDLNGSFLFEVGSFSLQV